MESLSVELMVFIVVLYFLPAVIASQRDTDHLGAIFFVNLICGWITLGWIATLSWAIVKKPCERSETAPGGSFSEPSTSEMP